METRTPEFDNVVHGFETLYMDFSKIMLAEIYIVQHANGTKKWIWENPLVHPETKQKRKEKGRKSLICEK